MLPYGRRCHLFSYSSFRAPLIPLDYVLAYSAWHQQCRSGP